MIRFVKAWWRWSKWLCDARYYAIQQIKCTPTNTFYQLDKVIYSLNIWGLADKSVVRVNLVLRQHFVLLLTKTVLLVKLAFTFTVHWKETASAWKQVNLFKFKWEKKKHGNSLVLLSKIPRKFSIRPRSRFLTCFRNWHSLEWCKQEMRWKKYARQWVSTFFMLQAIKSFLVTHGQALFNSSNALAY